MGNILGIGEDNLQMDPATGRAFKAGEQQANESARLSNGSGGPRFTGERVNLADAERARAEFLAAKAATVHPSDRAGMMNTASSDGSPRHIQATRPLTHDESLAKAMELLDGSRVQAQGLLSQGPSTGTRNDAGGQTPAWLTGYMDKEPDDIFSKSGMSDEQYDNNVGAYEDDDVDV